MKDVLLFLKQGVTYLVFCGPIVWSKEIAWLTPEFKYPHVFFLKQGVYINRGPQTLTSIVIYNEPFSRIFRHKLIHKVLCNNMIYVITIIAHAIRLEYDQFRVRVKQELTCMTQMKNKQKSHKRCTQQHGQCPGHQKRCSTDQLP